MLWVIYLAYNRASVVEKAIKRFRFDTDISGLRVNEVLAGGCYPLPSKHENKVELLEVAKNFNVGFLPIEDNQGQNGNMNKVNGTLAIKPSDIVVYFDPDNKIDKNGWLKDSIKLIKDKVADFVTLGCFHTVYGKHQNVFDLQGQLFEHEKIWFKELAFGGGFPIGVYSGRFLHKMQLPRTCPFYGCTEQDILNKLQEKNLRGVMLRDYIDLRDTVEHDEKYNQWKHETIGRADQMDFEEWLKSH